MDMGRPRSATMSCSHSMQDRIESISTMIGNTPLLRIEYEWDGEPGFVYAKYESENLTGSIKDRMAIYTLGAAYEQRRLAEGFEIVEATSGNTGISFAAIGRALGHPVRIFMPDWMSAERQNLIRSFGAEIILVSAEQGGFKGSVQLAEAYADQHSRVFLPRQFDNVDNVNAHRLRTGPEILGQLEQFGVVPDAFVAGVGTGGSVMGIGQFLKEKFDGVKVHPLEPANSPTLRTGFCVGKHRIQGISDEFVPSILDLDSLDKIVDVWDGDSILMAQNLCRNLGLAVGISSGANILGAILTQHEMGHQSTVVTLLPDSNKKYLSTDLCREEPVLEHYLTPRIKLNRFLAVR